MNIKDRIKQVVEKIEENKALEIEQAQERQEQELKNSSAAMKFALESHGVIAAEVASLDLKISVMPANAGTIDEINVFVSKGGTVGLKDSGMFCTVKVDGNKCYFMYMIDNSAWRVTASGTYLPSFESGIAWLTGAVRFEDVFAYL